MRILLSVVPLLVAGCFGTAPHVPSASSGNVPLTVVNASDRIIFAMAMWPDATDMDPQNWLGEGMRADRIEVGKQRAFTVKPGAYRLGFMFTDVNGQNNTRYFAGTYAKEAPKATPPIQIDGPTYMKVGTNPTAAPPNVAVVTFPVIDTYGNVKANCKEAGIPADNPEDCCSLLLSTETHRCAEQTD